jgi:hypothetical protein
VKKTLAKYHSTRFLEDLELLAVEGLQSHFLLGFDDKRIVREEPCRVALI